LKLMSKPTIRVSEAEAASDLRSLLETVVSSHREPLTPPAWD